MLGDAMEMLIRRKMRAKLVECSEGAVLFRHLGQIFFIESPHIEKYLPDLWNYLSEPRRMREIDELLQQKKAELSAREVVSNLRHLSLVEEVREASEALSEISPSIQEVASMIGWFEGKGRNQSVPLESSHIQRAKKALETPVIIHAEREFQGPLVAALAGVGFSDVRVGEIDCAGAVHILWGLWDHQKALLRVHHELMERSSSWLLVIEDELGGYLGPLYHGPGTPCLDCVLRRRRSGLRDAELMTKTELSGYETINQALPAAKLFRSRLADMAVFEVLKNQTEFVYPKLRRGVLAVDFLNHNQKFHEVLPVPGCPTCGDQWKGPPRARGYDGSPSI